MAAAIFWAIALMVVGSAVMTVVARNILHAAVALAFTFMGVAALYVFLHADFVAATQLIVYVGGIIVLVIFAVMFSAHIQDDTGELGSRPLIYGGAGLVGLCVIACLALSARHLQPTLEAARFSSDVDKTEYRENRLVEDHPVGPTPVVVVATPEASGITGAVTTPPPVPVDNPVNEFHPATKSIGAMLLGKYLLAFEAASILLLAVVVAAVVLVRKETMGEGNA